jgi:hypothetical protein
MEMILVLILKVLKLQNYLNKITDLKFSKELKESALQISQANF